MKKTRLAGWALFLLVPFYVSCIITVMDYQGGRFRTGDFHKRFSFEEGGVVSLRNIEGYVEIVGWDREEVEVTAERSAYRSSGRKVHMFRKRAVSPRIDVVRSGDSVAIVTKPLDMDMAPFVEYYVNVPSNVHLDRIYQRKGDILISSVFGSADVMPGDGDLVVENFSGSLTARVREGSAEVGLFDLRKGDEVRISVESGDIVVYLEKEADARIEAEAPDGDVSIDFKGERPSKRGLSVKLGRGGARIFLESMDGDIHIRKADDIRSE